MSYSLNEAMQNPVGAQYMANDAVGKQIHCAMPGIVISYNEAECTIIAQPTVKEALNGQMQSLPEIECPVFMPGGYRVPVQAGDECLIIYADTAVDSWWASGGVQSPSSLRRHSLSDGFALVGFFSRPRAAQIDDEVAPKKWVQEEIRKALAAVGGGT